MRTTLRPLRIDWMVAGLVAVVGSTEMLTIDAARGPRVLNVIVVLAVAFGIAWRRPFPLVATGYCMALLLVMNAWLTTVDESVQAFFPLFLCGYACGAWAAGRGWLYGWGMLVAAVSGVNLLNGTLTPGDFFFPSTMAGVAVLVGRAVRSRTELAAELHEAAVRAEEAHTEAESRAIADERRRIAREMHDVVAHSMSVMVVQAGGARRILTQDPARATEAAELIERTGREALTEMRRLLGVLRPGEAARAPQPGLDGLDALVERARSAGLPVELSVEGARPALAPGLELAAYRIVQEALTNAIKHAGTAPTKVDVRYGEEEVELVIENQSRPAGTPAVNGAAHGRGHGLVGMRERVKVFDGELEAGPGAGGGYRVRAVLPA
jgi:signal transduction histidine kinase